MKHTAVSWGSAEAGLRGQCRALNAEHGRVETLQISNLRSYHKKLEENRARKPGPSREIAAKTPSLL
jgi:hypothetical protein